MKTKYVFAFSESNAIGDAFVGDGNYSGFDVVGRMDDLVRYNYKLQGTLPLFFPQKNARILQAPEPVISSKWYGNTGIVGGGENNSGSFINRIDYINQGDLMHAWSKKILDNKDIYNFDYNFSPNSYFYIIVHFHCISILIKFII